jgi:hypothetical protein
MRVLPLFFAVAALIVSLAPARLPAQVEATPIPSPATPDFSAFRFLVGTWTCSTLSSRRPASFRTVVTYRLDPTGYWLDQRSTIRPMAWMKSVLTLLDRITYDPATNRWIDVLTGDQGAYGLSVSSGWRGSQITWRDLSFAPSADVSSQSDTTMRKASDTKTSSVSGFTEAKTGRRVTVTTTCVKG